MNLTESALDEVKFARLERQKIREQAKLRL